MTKTNKELNLPLPIDKMIRLLSRGMWGSIILIVLTFFLYVPLNSAGGAGVEIVTAIQVGLLVLCLLLIIALVCSSIVRAFVSRAYAKHISGWIKKKYDMDLSPKSVLEFTKSGKIDKSEQHNTVFLSKPILMWEANEKGVKVPYALNVQGFASGEYIVFDLTRGHEVLNEEDKKKEKLFNHVRKAASYNGFFTFVRDDAEDNDPDEIVDFSDPRDGRPLRIFWTDSVSIELYKNMNSLPYSVVKVSYSDWKDNLVPFLLLSESKVGFNWKGNEDDRVFSLVESMIFLFTRSN